jgi:hypothetical protein
MDSEKVEGLCFPLLFPHAEPAYTNARKSRMSPDKYAMSALLIYPPPFDPQRNEEEIAMEHLLQQVHIDSVDVEVTKDLFEIDGSRPPLVFEDPSSDFYGLTTIQYQGEIILWLQREYGLHVQVEYTLYEDYLVAQNQRQNIYPKYTAHLSDLLLLNRVIQSIVYNDAWYLPENPEFECGCLINIRGSIVYFTIPE